MEAALQPRKRNQCIKRVHQLRGWCDRAGRARDLNGGLSDGAVHLGTGESLKLPGRNLKPGSIPQPTDDKRSWSLWIRRTNGQPSSGGGRGSGKSLVTDKLALLLLGSSDYPYYVEMTQVTIIKAGSLWIVCRDNSTFVIQLQINPFCSAL